MNIYQCWYHGTLGYACRIRGKKWMFVPELGQPDNTVYKQLTIHELIFRNPLYKRHELASEQAQRFNLVKLIKSLLLPNDKPVTVAGLLLLPY